MKMSKLRNRFLKGKSEASRKAYNVLEVLSVVLEIEKETLLFVIVYCMPGPLVTFIDHSVLLINEHKILIVADFNLDQIFS